MPHYAWSEIRHTDADGKTTLVVRGDKVEKSQFKGLSDSDWQAWLDGGSVRSKPFPAPEDYEGSAIDYLRESLAEAQAVSTVDEEEATGALVEVQAQAASLEKVESSTKKSSAAEKES